MKRTCPRCKVSKPLAEFYKNKRRRSGVDVYCKVCQRESRRGNERILEYQRTYRTTRRSELYEWVNEVKRERGCDACGETEPVCLEFHHRDPSQKDKAISRMILNRSSQTRIAAEMGKCVVLCRNCHSKVHAGLMTGPPHLLGTPAPW